MKAMELARSLQLQTHAEQIMEYTGNDFNSTISTIAKENEVKERLGLGPVAPEPSSPAAAPEPSDDADEDNAPPPPTPQRSTPLYLEGDDAPPVLLRTDLSAAAKPLSRPA
jgi:hypothetical protein